MQYILVSSFASRNWACRWTHTGGSAANSRALIFRRIIFPSWISASNLDIASCKVSSCSTAFLLGGSIILKGSKGFPLLKSRLQSIQTAKNTEIDANTYLIHPLYIKSNALLHRFVKIINNSSNFINAATKITKKIQVSQFMCMNSGHSQLSILNLPKRKPSVESWIGNNFLHN